MINIQHYGMPLVYWRIRWHPLQIHAVLMENRHHQDLDNGQQPRKPQGFCNNYLEEKIRPLLQAENIIFKVQTCGKREKAVKILLS